MPGPLPENPRHRLTGFARGVISWSGTPGASAASITGGNVLKHAAITGEQSWTLDRRGNWTTFVSKIGDPLVTTTQNRTQNAANEYTALDPDGPNPPGTQSPGALNHDAKGNLTLDPYAPNYNGAAAGQKYEYDAENRLIRVRANDGSPGTGAPGTVLFDISYDAIGRRIASVDHTGSSNPDEQCGGDPQPVATRHVFSGIQTIEEYICCSDDPGGEDCDPSEDWDLAREFIWGPRFPEPVVMVDHTDAGDVPATGTTGGGPEIVHYLHDVLGSSIVLTNSDGAAVERYTYDPYGRTVIETYDASLNGGSGGWVVSGAGGAGRSKYGNPFLWTGQRYDAGVLLYHFLFRSYSPSLGRWLSRDPAGYVDGVNLYAYAMGSPFNLVDPLGLSSFKNKSGWFPPFTGVIIFLNDGTRLEFHPRTLEDLQRYINVFREDIVSIYIYGHGSPGVQLVGEHKDNIEDEPLVTYVNVEAVLGDLVGVCLFLMGCDVADDPKYLQDIADLTGATVTGYTGDTMTWGETTTCSFNTGSEVTVEPSATGSW